MNEHDDYVPKESPLSQSVTREGKTVSIEIYEDGSGKWRLEVVDEFNNSTVWDEPLNTEEEALAEAMRTIEEEGISSLIGPPSGALH